MYRDIVCFFEKRIKLSDCLLKTTRRILSFAIYKEGRRESVCVCVCCVCVCVSSLFQPLGEGVCSFCLQLEISEGLIHCMSYRLENPPVIERDTCQ